MGASVGAALCRGLAQNLPPVEVFEVFFEGRELLGVLFQRRRKHVDSQCHGQIGEEVNRELRARFLLEVTWDE